MENQEPRSTLDIALECIKEALAPHFKGKNSDERLNEAANAALGSVAHMITVRQDVKKKPIGATVMTEQASAVIRPGIAPRSM